VVVELDEQLFVADDFALPGFGIDGLQLVKVSLGKSKPLHSRSKSRSRSRSNNPTSARWSRAGREAPMCDLSELEAAD